MTEAKKMGRPQVSEMKFGEVTVKLPPEGPGVVLIKSNGNVLRVGVSKNMKVWARQMLHYQSATVRLAIANGDLEFEVVAHQTEPDYPALQELAAKLKTRYDV